MKIGATDSPVCMCA